MVGCGYYFFAHESVNGLCVLVANDPLGLLVSFEYVDFFNLFRVGFSCSLVDFSMESLILAQDERWRRA